MQVAPTRTEPVASTFATIPDIVDAARAKLDPLVWDFLSGGSETEHTMRGNREALDRLTFAPRVLVDMSRVETSTRFLGVDLRVPALLAPIGSIARFVPDGALAVARVAARKGSLCFVGVNATPSLSDVARESDAPLVFQIYGYDDHDVMAAMVRRAEDAGCVALCVTADSATYGRRERDLRSGFKPLDKPGRPSMDDVPGAASRESRARFTWEDLAWLRDHTKLPLILKGVLSAEDAVLAVETGVEVVYVSNHGGRQLDYAPATIDVLPEVVAAVGDRAEVLVDSGFERGTDILKAVALGAKAVGLGKLQGWAVAADGEAGLERALDLLEEEMRTSLALIGVQGAAQLTPGYLRR